MTDSEITEMKDSIKEIRAELYGNGRVGLCERVRLLGLWQKIALGLIMASIASPHLDFLMHLIRGVI